MSGVLPSSAPPKHLSADLPAVASPPRRTVIGVRPFDERRGLLLFASRDRARNRDVHHHIAQGTEYVRDDFHRD